MATTVLHCVLVSLLLTAATASSESSSAASSSSHLPELFNSPLLTDADWQKQLSTVFQIPKSCDPGDSHCTVSKTGSANSKSSSSSLFGGNDEDYHCQVSADGKSKSCSYSSSSSSPGSAMPSGFSSFWNNVFKIPAQTQRSRKLLQFSCPPNDPHCTTSTNGNTMTSTSIIGSGSDENCQVSADGHSMSCSSSYSSGGGSANASTQSGFWSSVGTAATTWWVWVLFILAAAIALFTLARRRTVYVMLRGGSNQDSSMGLPRFTKGRDNKEAQIF